MRPHTFTPKILPKQSMLNETEVALKELYDLTPSNLHFVVDYQYNDKITQATTKSVYDTFIAINGDLVSLKEAENFLGTEKVHVLYKAHFFMLSDPHIHEIPSWMQNKYKKPFGNKNIITQHILPGIVRTQKIHPHMSAADVVKNNPENDLIFSTFFVNLPENPSNHAKIAMVQRIKDMEKHWVSEFDDIKNRLKNNNSINFTTNPYTFL